MLHLPDAPHSFHSLRVLAEIAQGLRQAFSEGETFVGTAGADGLDSTGDRLTLEISIHYPKSPRTQTMGL